ncbi:MAG: hypothetical protein ACLQJR_05830 [Stellaceae bacterium]
MIKNVLTGLVALVALSGPAYANAAADAQYVYDVAVANCNAQFGKNTAASKRCVDTEMERQSAIAEAKTKHDNAVAAEKQAQVDQQAAQTCARLRAMPDSDPVKASGMKAFCK